jgi:hypothetical protein
MMWIRRRVDKIAGAGVASSIATRGDFDHATGRFRAIPCSDQKFPVPSEKFPVRREKFPCSAMLRELGCKPLICLIDWTRKTPERAESGKIPC